MKRIILILFICVAINSCDKLFSAGGKTLSIIRAFGNTDPPQKIREKQLVPDKFCPDSTNWENDKIPLILSEATYFLCNSAK
ncbi:MAG: hypothetical protein WKF68_02560 [Daejeonella sp.]